MISAESESMSFRGRKCGLLVEPSYLKRKKEKKENVHSHYFDIRLDDIQMSREIAPNHHLLERLSDYSTSIPI